MHKIRHNSAIGRVQTIIIVASRRPPMRRSYVPTITQDVVGDFLSPVYSTCVCVYCLLSIAHAIKLTCVIRIIASGISLWKG